MSEQHSKLGYSAVSTFENCPYQYRLRYIDKVEMLETTLTDEEWQKTEQTLSFLTEEEWDFEHPLDE